MKTWISLSFFAISFLLGMATQSLMAAPEENFEIRPWKFYIKCIAGDAYVFNDQGTDRTWDDEKIGPSLSYDCGGLKIAPDLNNDGRTFCEVQESSILGHFLLGLDSRVDLTKVGYYYDTANKMQRDSKRNY